MMRYQRVSPDCLHLGNGGKSNLRTCKDDEGGDNGRIPNYNTFKGKPLKFRSPSNCLEHNFSHSVTPNSPQHDNHVTPKNHNHESIAKSSPSRGSDVLLQWGQNKRSRGPRTENHRVSSDDSSGQARQVIKIHRRVVEKQPSVNQTATMPPPPPPCSSSSYSRGGNPRSSTPSRETCGAFLKRSLDERSSTGHGSPSRSNGGSSSSRVGCRSTEKVSASSPEKTDQKVGGSVTVMAEKSNGCLVVQAGKMNLGESNTEQETGGHAATERLNLDQFEWPRIYISLSRKEKEDDFLAMKGTKLSQRPKKRAKNIDKTLQYCFPGMWLSDLTRGRYEVREKKCVKKQKRKGLKGMESMDSDSEE